MPAKAEEMKLTRSRPEDGGSGQLADALAHPIVEAKLKETDNG